MPGSDGSGTAPNGHKPLWMTVDDVARELQITYQTALGMIKSGTIRGRNIGLGKRRATWRVHRKDFDALRNPGGGL